MYSLLFHNFFHWNWSLRVPSKDKSWSFKGAKTFFFLALWLWSLSCSWIINIIEKKESMCLITDEGQSISPSQLSFVTLEMWKRSIRCLTVDSLSLSLSSKVVSISEEIETLMCTLNFFQDFLGSPSSLSFLTGRSSWMSAYSGQVFKIHSRISWKLVLLPNTALDENFPETVTLHTHQCVRNQWPRYC